MQTVPRHIEDFLTHLVKDLNRAASTKKGYRTRLMDFYRFIIASYSVTDLAEVKQQFIIDYKAQLEGQGWARNSVANYLKTIRKFYKWMAKDGRIDGSPYPEDVVVRPTESKPKVVPTPEEIFKIRRKREVPLSNIAAFELMLSTGMRVGELKQLRVEDITWDDRPMDLETKELSESCLGSIIADPSVSVHKGKKSRKLYMSIIAAKMTRKYIAKLGLPLDSPLPLFPYTTQAIEAWFEMLGNDVITKPLEQRATTDRTPGYQDVDLDQYKGISDSFKKKIAKKQAKEDGQDHLDKHANRRVRRRTRIKLHPHAMRHTFTCAQYYRNFFGERQNTTRLMQMLGHASMTMTFSYLLRLDLVHDDKTWERLWRGKITDWMNPK